MPDQKPEEDHTILVHMHHCYQGDYEDVCKYGDDDCPARPEARPPMITVEKMLEAVKKYDGELTGALDLIAEDEDAMAMVEAWERSRARIAREYQMTETLLQMAWDVWSRKQMQKLDEGAVHG